MRRTRQLLVVKKWCYKKRAYSASMQTRQQQPLTKGINTVAVTKRPTFKQWLKEYPIIQELYGDLPESYLRLMHFQDMNKGGAK